LFSNTLSLCASLRKPKLKSKLRSLTKIELYSKAF
jgi:hypothetical protein